MADVSHEGGRWREGGREAEESNYIPLPSKSPEFGFGRSLITK